MNFEINFLGKISLSSCKVSNIHNFQQQNIAPSLEHRTKKIEHFKKLHRPPVHKFKINYRYVKISEVIIIVC